MSDMFIRPTESEVRAHYGGLIPKDAIIETIPHTSLWALTSGVLLWDGQNGYTNLLEDYSFKYEPPFTPIHKPAKKFLKSIIYLSGPQGSGKSTCAQLFENAFELERGDYISFTDLSRALSTINKRATIVVTDQSYDMDFERLLKGYVENKGLLFYSINLKQK